MERLVNQKAVDFLRKYKLKYFHYANIFKTEYFNDMYKMDWLVGEWIIATNIKDIEEDDDRFLTPRVFSGINFRDDRYRTIEMIEDVKKIVFLYWPFYIFNKGKKINILPVFDYYSNLAEFQTEKNFEKFFREINIKAIDEIYQTTMRDINVENTETFKKSKYDFFEEEWYLSTGEIKIDDSKNYLFDFESELSKNKLKKIKRKL